MKQTLSELWNGEIHPLNDTAEDNEKIKELRGNLERYNNILWTKLDDEGKCTLDKLRDCHNRISYLETEDSFIRGFSLAVKMMTEVLAE